VKCSKVRWYKICPTRSITKAAAMSRPACMLPTFANKFSTPVLRRAYDNTSQ